MICLKLMGGLGNQMFQYAFARHLAIINNANLQIEAITYFKDYGADYPSELIWETFNVIGERIDPCDLKKLFNNTMLQKLCLKTKWYHINEIHFDKFQEDVLRNYNKNLFIKAGFWQNERYFIAISDIIKKDYTFKKNYSDIFQDTIIKNNSVAIHLRRGDYLSEYYSGRYHDLTSSYYYIEAIKYMSDKIKDPYFYIFSDDLKWCKQQFSNIKNIVFIENTEGAAHELYLISLCKHQIIANSTFGWWGAWLNNNEKKIVICPKKWFVNDWEDSHYSLSGWIKL